MSDTAHITVTLDLETERIDDASTMARLLRGALVGVEFFSTELGDSVGLRVVGVSDPLHTSAVRRMGT